MAQPTAIPAPPYVPERDLEWRDDGTGLLTHLASGRTRAVAIYRQALIVGIAIAA